MTQPDAPAPKRRWYAPLLAGDLAALWPAIVAAFLGVLLIAFGLSYHGIYTFGERIMRWPIYLCVLAPVGLDVFSLVGLIATFLTRDAHWRIRIYCWAALIFTVALSIGANAISAYSLLTPVAPVADDPFDWGYAQVSAVGFAAVWPALSAVALHVLIVVRRHLDEQRDRKRQADREVAKRREREAAEVQYAIDAELLLEAHAIRLAATGATASAIVAELKMPESKRRTVERWTEPIRTALATPRPAVAAKTPPRRAALSRRVPDTSEGNTS